MNAISVRDMVKSYGGFTLGPVNLDIPRGCITGIIGKNGAGKTTLLKTILGIVPNDKGTIEIFGKPMHGNEKELKNKIGVMWGPSSMYSHMTLKALTKNIRRFYKDWNEDAYRSYIKRFELDENKKYWFQSMGMRVKYNIALALSHNAELIIMDEPTSGLDPLARGELMKIFSELIAEKEVAIVISTHITSDLDRTADYITMIDDGKLLFSTPKDELLENRRIVKGSVDALTDEVINELVSYNINAYYFEGLTENVERMKARYPEFAYDKPIIEDIMRFYVGEEDAV